MSLSAHRGDKNYPADASGIPETPTGKRTKNTELVFCSQPTSSRPEHQPVQPVKNRTQKDKREPEQTSGTVFA